MFFWLCFLFNKLKDQLHGLTVIKSLIIWNYGFKKNKSLSWLSLYGYRISRSKIWVCFFFTRQCLRIRYKFTLVVLTGAFVFLRIIDIRFIRIFIPTRILNEAINKTSIIVTIIKKNWFFLTNKMIYIICISKLHNFSKQIDIDR